MEKKKRYILLAIISIIVAGLLYAVSTKKSKSNVSYQIAADKELTEVEISGMGFPRRISQAQIEIESIGSYDGKYVEDGSDDEVQNIFAMVVTNTSSSFIEYSMIELVSGSETYNFEISCLPAGEKVLVLEKNRKEYISDHDYEIGECASAYRDIVDYSQQIEVTAKQDTLTFKNLTNQDLINVRACYKNKTDDYYLGGITYRLTVPVLNANESFSKRSAHFSDSSVILFTECDQ